MLTDERLREGRREATRRQREDCPPSDELTRYAADAVGSRERLRLVDHLVECADCAEEYRLLRPVRLWAGEAAPVAETSPTPRVGGGWRGWYGWAVAGAAAAIAGVIIVPRLGEEAPKAPRLRGAEPASLRSRLGPNHALPRDRCVLRWAGPPGARYRVLVTLPDLTVLFEAQGLRRTQLVVPRNALSRVPKDGPIHWRVEAVLPDGRRLVSSAFVARVE